MLDTVKLKVVGAEWPEHSLPGWWRSERSVTSAKLEVVNAGVAIPGGGGLTYGPVGESVLQARCSRTETHAASGARVMGGAESPAWLEASLPRVLYGNNGRLIMHQADLSRAWSALEGLLSELDIKLEAVEWDAPRRVDLALNWLEPTSEWVGSLQHVMWSGIRKPGHVWPDGTSVSWKGTAYGVYVYNKLAELGKDKGGRKRVVVPSVGDLTRMEIRLYRVLAPSLVGGVLRDWSGLYSVYRDLVGLCGVADVPAGSFDLYELLALSELRGWEVAPGLSVLAAYCRGKSVRAVRDVRLQVGLRSCAVAGWDWAGRLPAGRPRGCGEVCEGALRACA